MPMVTPVMMMAVFEVVANHRAADPADNRAHGAGHHGASDRAGRRASDNALVGRLGRAGGPESQSDAADQHQTLHLGLPNRGFEEDNGPA